ncbi:MAG: transcriptional regulator [Deltaproteobacteria bacterium]|nr:transcriptional regulator [Deltaproteobacteria bacterium]
MTLLKILGFASFFFASHAWSALQVGQVPPPVVLDGQTGGKVAGGSWDSSHLKGKVHVLFYVAPAAEDLNKKASEALKNAKFPEDKFASVAVVNMKASWWPNWLINQKLQKSQENYPTTLYVEDRAKELVGKWKLEDHSSDIVVLDKEAKVIFSVDGKLSDTDISNMLASIQAQLQG